MKMIECRRVVPSFWCLESYVFRHVCFMNIACVINIMFVYVLHVYVLLSIQKSWMLLLLVYELLSISNYLWWLTIVVIQKNCSPSLAIVTHRCLSHSIVTHRFCIVLDVGFRYHNLMCCATVYASWPIGFYRFLLFSIVTHRFDYLKENIILTI